VSATILEANKLTKVYGNGETQVIALDNIDLKITKGEFVAIIGASGSGKSTLLHLLGGIDQPTSGTVRVDGHDLYQMNESKRAIFRRRNIGIVYQFYNLVPTLTAVENVTLPCLLDNRAVDQSRLAEIMQTTGLNNRENHLPSELSGGQQQRVSIGRALINDPAIILADEPTGNLDSKSSAEIIDIFRLANKKYNQTLIIITNDEKIALQADRIITMSDGRIVSDEVIR